MSRITIYRIAKYRFDDKHVLDIFGLLSGGESSGRVTRRAALHLRDIHLLYGVYLPMNRYRTALSKVSGAATGPPL